MKIKIYSVLLLLILAAPFSLSQNFESGTFGSPVFKYTSILKQNSLIIGGRFGWVINKSFVLGGGFYGLTGSVRTNYIDKKSGQNVRMGFNFGGLELEYISFSGKPVHVSIDMLFAGGGLYFSVADKSVPHNSYFSQDLLVWEPSINLEINTLSWLKTDLNFSYRMITSFKGSYGITKEDLTGPAVGIAFKLGSF